MKYLSARAAEFRKEGTFDAELTSGATLARDEIERLISARYQGDEAEEVVLPMFILLPLERGAARPKWRLRKASSSSESTEKPCQWSSIPTTRRRAPVGRTATGSHARPGRGQWVT